MPLADLIKEIEAKKAKAVSDRLKKEKANGKYVPDPKKPLQHHTPLHHAVRFGDVAVVESLLSAAADVNAVDNQEATPLHWSACSDSKDAPRITELLLKKKARLDAVNKAKLTPLQVSAAAGCVPVLDVLLKAGAPAEGGSPSPLHAAVAACCSGSLKPSRMLEVADRLAAAGASLATKDASGRTALMVLVGAGRVAEALQLLERPGCGVDELDGEGYSALLREVCLSEQPRMDLVRGLVEKGASPDMQDPTPAKDTPLHVAARRGDLALLRALLAGSKKPHTRNAKKLTPAEVALSECAAAAPQAGAPAVVAAGTGAAAAAALAAREGHGGVKAGGSGASAAAGAAAAEALVAAGGDPGEAGVGIMRAAVAAKADGVAAQLVELLKPAALASLDLEFKTLVAAGLGKAAMTYLKRFDAEHAGSDSVVDASTGNTHLHLIAEGGASYEAVRGVVSLGLNPNAINKEGDTPLHVAARAGHVEVCRALVDAGADVLRRNAKNRTPRSQLKLPEAAKDYLGGAEEAFKAAKEARKGELWDDKMRATQTESAFGVRAL